MKVIPSRELIQSWCEQSPCGDQNRAPYIPAGNSPNPWCQPLLCGDQNRGYLHPNRKLTQPWRQPSPCGDQIEQAAWFNKWHFVDKSLACTARLTCNFFFNYMTLSTAHKPAVLRWEISGYVSNDLCFGFSK